MNQPPAKNRIEPVKLFVAALYRERSFLEEARARLTARFGPEDYLSGPFPFDHTAFYEAEMGGPLARVFISYRDLVHPSVLAPAKVETSRIESELAAPDGSRRVNLDPGLLDYQKVVLASFKHMGQKIYLDLGVWADLTLYYRKGGWSFFEWTFPDFKEGRYDRALLDIRLIYKSQRREEATNQDL
jgi:hypothetical protein